MVAGPPPGGWRPARVPCHTCPYRADVPSGVWEAAEYDKLPGYDGDVPDHLAAGATALFFCHQGNGKLCAGWVGCHDMSNTLAVRLHHRDVHPGIYDYQSPVPLLGSGAEAAAHGLADIDNPGRAARDAARKLARLRARRAARER